MPCLMPPHCMTISILKKVHEKIIWNRNVCIDRKLFQLEYVKKLSQHEAASLLLRVSLRLAKDLLIMLVIIVIYVSCD